MRRQNPIHCSFTERYVRTNCFGQIDLLKQSIYVIAIVKCVRSQKLQNTLTHVRVGFTLYVLMRDDDDGGRPKHVARSVRFINLLCLTAINKLLLSLLNIYSFEYN